MFQIRFWGVRGSIATSGERTAQVGGNTSCVEVRAGGELLILDAGTGLRALGDDLLRRGGPLAAHVLVSHLHWDHIQGFPFFVPAYRPGGRLDVWGPAEDGAALRAAFDLQMRAPHFPVGLDAMRATLGFHGLQPGGVVQIGTGGVTVRAAAAHHPNGCLAYRIEHEGRAIVYATDHEHRGHRCDATLLELARGADVLVYDAQYTPVEYAAGKQGWGHSTWEEATWLAAAAGVGQLVLFHHDPGHDDWEVARIEAAARAAFPRTLAAREGLTLAVAPEAHPDAGRAAA